MSVIECQDIAVVRLFTKYYKINIDMSEAKAFFVAVHTMYGIEIRVSFTKNMHYEAII